MIIISGKQGRYQSIIAVVIMLICLFILSACGLPANPREIFPKPLIINEQSQLAKRILPDNTKHQGKSGVFVLYDGEDAFTARLALIKKAEQTIDAQYYIWHDDVSGRLLLKELYKAGERGVKVRLLLDDNGTVGLDRILVRLNNHPNITVKLFNPYMQRKFRSFAYFTDTVRINRRMHNKSLTVDGLISIIGGRNVGDEYFAVKKELVFADLDVSLVGKVVGDVQHDFNRYWVSGSSYPLEKIVKYQIDNKKPIKIRKLKKTKKYLMRLFDVKYFNYINEPNSPLIWTDVEYISDPPSKARQGRKFQFDDSLLAKLFPLVASTEKQLILISPYFVPTKAGTDFLINMVKRGKRVVVITNSLSATDVTIVHSGYEKYRKKLLAGGVELYEFKDDPQNDEYGKKNYRKKYKDTYDVNGRLPNSGASLHAKASIFDDKLVFIGSANFDPRSAMLNTEDGVIIESKPLAKGIAKAFEQNKDIVNYQLKLSPKGKLEWHTLENGKRVTYYHEPHSSLKDKALSDILSMFPLDGWL